MGGVTAGLAVAELAGLTYLTPSVIAASFEDTAVSPNLDQIQHYTKTIEVLKSAYFDEIQSYHIYSKFSQKARSENLPNVAYLFKTFAESEFINARNFYNLLYDLKAHIQSEIKPIEVASTQKNLQLAIALELEEIEEHYPEFISRIKEEEHINAISFIQHALIARRQHQDYLLKMKSGSGFFWKTMSQKMESAELQFYICQICGSIQNEKPHRTCPICDNPAYFYRDVERPKPPLGSPALTQKYANTIWALKEAHTDEIQAYNIYLKYSEKALQENAPNIAYIFKAFAECAFISARNCYNLLRDMKQEHRVKAKPIAVSTSHENLAAAIALELEETEAYYPQLIQKIKKEDHYNALAFAQHALDAIKQNVALLLHLQSDDHSREGFLFADIADPDFNLFTCQICGSVRTRIPETTCPVCENPGHLYKKTERPA
jgi:rubrerythrin